MSNLLKFDCWATLTRVDNGEKEKIKRTLAVYCHPDKAEQDVRARFSGMLGVPESLIRVKEHYPSLTIYEVKRLHERAGGKFFDRSHMKAHGQRLKDFSVVKDGKGGYLVTAPIKKWGVNTGHFTKQTFNPNTGELNGTR